MSIIRNGPTVRNTARDAVKIRKGTNAENRRKGIVAIGANNGTVAFAEGSSGSGNAIAHGKIEKKFDTRAVEGTGDGIGGNTEGKRKDAVVNGAGEGKDD